MADNKKDFENKTEIVGGKPMTPEEAQENKRQIDEEKKKLSDPNALPRNVPPDAEMNKPPQPSDPETLRSAEATSQESGESKAKRVDTADVDPAGESAPAGWGKKPTVYVMTNVDGEKLYVTVKQWAKHGQVLRSKGWTTPEFAEGNPGGNEGIPQDIEWGKDKGDDFSGPSVTLPPVNRK